MNRELEGGHQAQGTQPPRTSAAALESTARRRGATSNGARDGAQRGRGSVDRVSTAGRPQVNSFQPPDPARDQKLADLRAECRRLTTLADLLTTQLNARQQATPSLAPHRSFHGHLPQVQGTLPSLPSIAPPRRSGTASPLPPLPPLDTHDLQNRSPAQASPAGVEDAQVLLALSASPRTAVDRSSREEQFAVASTANAGAEQRGLRGMLKAPRPAGPLRTLSAPSTLPQHPQPESVAPYALHYDSTPSGPPAASISAGSGSATRTCDDSNGKRRAVIERVLYPTPIYYPALHRTGCSAAEKRRLQADKKATRSRILATPLQRQQAREAHERRYDAAYAALMALSRNSNGATENAGAGSAPAQTPSAMKAGGGDAMLGSTPASPVTWSRNRSESARPATAGGREVMQA